MYSMHSSDTWISIPGAKYPRKSASKEIGSLGLTVLKHSGPFALGLWQVWPCLAR